MENCQLKYGVTNYDYNGEYFGLYCHLKEFDLATIGIKIVHLVLGFVKAIASRYYSYLKDKKWTLKV